MVAGRALEMLRLRSPLLHSSETRKTERRAHFDKRPGRWVENSKYRTLLSVPIDSCWVTIARQSQFAERLCFVPRRHCRKYYPRALRPAEEHRESWKPPHTLPCSRLTERWSPLCRCRNSRFCLACPRIGRDARSASQYLVSATC